MKAIKDRQKSYVDNRKMPLKFEMGDQLFLKVAPWKHIILFGMKGKLAPKYIGPFEIVQKIGPVAYRLTLPPHLSKMHDVFHILLLRNAKLDPTRVLSQVPLEIKEDLTLEV